MKFEFLVCLILVLAICGAAIGDIANFDDLTLDPNTYWNGSNGTGDFASGSATFNNNYNFSYSSWDGWSYSNKPQSSETGTAGQYTAKANGAQSGSNYGIAFIGFAENPSVTLDTADVVGGLFVTNNNYAYDAMLNGDTFSKKFGGVSGDDEDWFKLTIEGFDAGSSSTGTVDFYLADYRFADNGQDYIVGDWGYVNLASLGTVKSLEFTLNSSDVGEFGMNTPAYFAMDTVVPEPTTIALLGIGGLVLRRRRG